MSTKIQLKRGTDAEVKGGTLAVGEMGFATDTKHIYVYDGVAKQIVGRAIVDIMDNRPAYGSAGRFFIDSAANLLYLDTGAAWVAVAPASHTIEGHTATVTIGKVLTGSGTNTFGWADPAPTWGQVSGKPATFAPVIGSGAGDAVAGNDSRLTNTRTPTNHNLVDTTGHPVSGLTTGHVLTASSATAYGFAAPGVAASQVTAAAFPSGQFSFGSVYSTQGGNTTATGTLTLDLAASNNFYYTLEGNITLANPSNMAAGQSGIVTLVQDGSGGRTLTLGTYWKFPDGASKTLSTGISAVDALTYYVASSTVILCQLLLKFA